MKVLGYHEAETGGPQRGQCPRVSASLSYDSYRKQEGSRSMVDEWEFRPLTRALSVEILKILSSGNFASNKGS